jgi:hypothetical protein
MSKSKGNKSKKKPPAPKPSAAVEPPWWKKHWMRVVGISTFVVALVGFVSALATFVPRVTVDAGSLIDPADPLSVPFTITNTTVVPLEHVSGMVGICRIWLGDRLKIESTAGDCSKSNYALLVHPPWQEHRLASDQAFTITLRDAVQASGMKEYAEQFPKYLPEGRVSYSSADISVIVTFHPWLLPIERRKEFRFIGKRESNGTFVWQRQSIDRPS